ncbi:uncharacterized protein LOC126775776 [Nymphalis io]|uniref:uncharacterized protein LOC126775776 n=1 Tax=Inachis io TaxID=171585 RepID=UPI0021674077|nr:uncharacterized protein LOC126775776 [Nymphalis io]
MRLISILVCTMTIYKCVVPRKWFDSSKDELAYVDNPVESEFPGHWLPVSLIKRIMEMRVRTTPEKYNFNNKPLFKQNDVTRQPLYLKKTVTPRERLIMTSIKISAKPSSVKLYLLSSKLAYKDVNVQSTNYKMDVSSTIQDGKVEVTNLSTRDTTTVMAKVISTSTNTEIATNSKTLTSTVTTTAKIPLTASTVVQSTESVMRNIATTNQISPKILTTTKQLTTAEITTDSTTEMVSSTSENSANEKEMQTNKTETPMNTTTTTTTTTTKLTTVAPQPLTTTISTTPTTTTETGNPFY